MAHELVTLSSLLNPLSLVLLFAATLAGIVIGALPGLTATMGVSLLVSTTLGMGAGNAMIVMCGVFLGGIYGGSRSAILLNVPGTPSSAATALEGFPLTKRGEGAYAGVVVTTFSAMGGLVGVAILVLAAGPISKFALNVGYWEYFWLGLFGIVISGTMAADKPYKGLIAGLMGLVISTIGIDGIYGATRFTFDSTMLKAGISLVPAMVGLFGLSEAFDALTDSESHAIAQVKQMTIGDMFRLVGKSFKLLFQKIGLFLQSSVIGTLIGAIPGTGADIASWVAYDAAKRRSKHKEEFGNGSYEGLIASETSNNACTSGVFIPMLTLGVAGDAVSAIMLGGLQLHGYDTGPSFLGQNPGFLAFIGIVLIMVNIALLIEGVVLTPIIARILQAKVGYIMPTVITLCVIGAYANNIRTFDITVMFIFGVVGWIMRKVKLPTAPLALGIILGSMVELNFRKGLMASKFHFGRFFVRPVSALLVIILVLVLFWPLIRKLFLKKGSAAQ